MISMQFITSFLFTHLHTPSIRHSYVVDACNLATVLSENVIRIVSVLAFPTQQVQLSLLLSLNARHPGVLSSYDITMDNGVDFSR